VDIDVQVPLRTTTAYEFTCEVRPRRSLRQRLSRHRGDVPTGSSELRFGYHATNFEIEHHDAWDGFYALYFLTRNGGPLFARGYDRAHIRLHFPVATVVRRFFIRRAADFGIDITVEAPTAPLRLDRPTRGHVLAFGGGKDSRLILGLLHESGVEPEVITSMPARASDIPAALVTKSVHGAIADRLMPGLMRLPRHFYYGGGLGEVQLRTPWQQHYDIASRTGRDQLAGLLATLGAEIEVHAPTVVLPANLAQRILYERYPELFAGQQSTRPEAQSNKNLHVALIRMLHGLPLQDGMDAALFGRLLGITNHDQWEATESAFEEGCAALVDESWSRARSAFEKVLLAEPEWGRAKLFASVALLLDEGDPAQAAREAGEAIRMLPDDYDGQRLLVLLELVAGLVGPRCLRLRSGARACRPTP